MWRVQIKINNPHEESHPPQIGLPPRDLPLCLFFFNNATCHCFPPPLKSSWISPPVVFHATGIAFIFFYGNASLNLTWDELWDYITWKSSTENIVFPPSYNSAAYEADNLIIRQGLIWVCFAFQIPPSPPCLSISLLSPQHLLGNYNQTRA